LIVTSLHLVELEIASVSAFLPLNLLSSESPSVLPSVSPSALPSALSSALPSALPSVNFDGFELDPFFARLAIVRDSVLAKQNFNFSKI
jgi:hypothetical protein